MSTPPITTLPYNWSTSRAGHGIVAIIAHNTVGTDSRGYLSRGGELPDGSDRKVSIHVLIRRDSHIYRYVPDEIGANHAGFGTMPKPWSTTNPNLITLGFELENRSNGMGVVEPYTDVQLQAMGWQIRAWRARWGNLPILRHADIDPDRRKDTAGLSVAEIERYAAAAPVNPALGLYQFDGLAVYQRADLTGQIADYLPPGSIVSIDAVGGPGYAPTAGHLLSGLGFVDMRLLRKVGS